MTLYAAIFHLPRYSYEQRVLGIYETKEEASEACRNYAKVMPLSESKYFTVKTFTLGEDWTKTINDGQVVSLSKSISEETTLDNIGFGMNRD